MSTPAVKVTIDQREIEAKLRENRARKLALEEDLDRTRRQLISRKQRALEFERPFVRATNTGATAIIDHRGQVITELTRNTRGVLRGEEVEFETEISYAHSGRPFMHVIYTPDRNEGGEV